MAIEATKGGRNKGEEDSELLHPRFFRHSVRNRVKKENTVTSYKEDKAKYL